MKRASELSYRMNQLRLAKQINEELDIPCEPLNNEIDNIINHFILPIKEVSKTFIIDAICADLLTLK